MLERPALKLSEPPERVLVTIDVSIETKRKFEWVAEATGRSITKLLEGAAANWERMTLEKLKPEQREAYLSGTLTREAAFGKRFRRKQRDLPDEEAVISAKITLEARAQLDRFSKLAEIPLPVVAERYAAGLEKRLRRLRDNDPKPPEPDPAPQLDPSMAELMQPALVDA